MSERRLSTDQIAVRYLCCDTQTRMKQRVKRRRATLGQAQLNRRKVQLYIYSYKKGPKKSATENSIFAASVQRRQQELNFSFFIFL